MTYTKVELFSNEHRLTKEGWIPSQFARFGKQFITKELGHVVVTRVFKNKHEKLEILAEQNVKRYEIVK